VDLPAVGQPGAALDLAVDSDDPPAGSRGRCRGGQPGAQPVGQDGLQHGGLDAHQQPPQRGQGWDPVGEPEPATGARVEVHGPVGDRGERRRAGQDRAHRYGEQAAQGVADPARVTGVRYPGQSGEQVVRLVEPSRHDGAGRGGGVLSNHVDQR
jgi:hypothetical protein